jgi:hypothetical protein
MLLIRLAQASILFGSKYNIPLLVAPTRVQRHHAARWRKTVVRAWSVFRSVHLRAPIATKEELVEASGGSDH